MAIYTAGDPEHAYQALLRTILGKQAAYEYERRVWRKLNNLPKGHFRGGKGDGT